MADKKPGPVKPPIIDAKPRPADKPRQADKPAAEKPTPTAQPTAKPTPDTQAPKPATEPAASATKSAPEAAKTDSPAPKPSTSTTVNALPFLPLAAAAGAGALTGLVFAYGLASFGLWPQHDDSGTLDSRTAGLEAALAAQQSETAEFTTRLDAMAGQLTGIESREPVSTEGLAAQADLDALAGRLAELSTRIDAIAAGASGEEATEVATALSEISADIGTLTGRLETIEPQIAQFDSLVTRLDDLDTRIADQADFDALAAERDRVARLPAALGALETAIMAGDPFANQLAALETLLPLDIPEGARAAAASGVTPPTGLLAQFRAAIPAMLAARPQDENAGWAETLFDQAAATLALRPTDGETPEGRVGRTEAALASGDLDAAQTAFATLPEPMQAAAPGFAERLAETRTAQALLAAARAADPLATGTEATR